MRFYPLLAGVLPVLMLAGNNKNEFIISEASTSVLLTLLLAALIYAAVLLFIKDRDKAGLIGLMTLIVFFAYQDSAGLLTKLSLPAKSSFFGVLCGAFFAGFYLLYKKSGKKLGQGIVAVTTATIVLIALDVVVFKKFILFDSKLIKIEYFVLGTMLLSFLLNVVAKEQRFGKLLVHYKKIFPYLYLGFFILAGRGVIRDIASWFTTKYLHDSYFVLSELAVFSLIASYLVLKSERAMLLSRLARSSTIAVFLIVAAGIIPTVISTKNRGAIIDDVSKTANAESPDIYYVILDRYPSNASLSEYYGFDNHAFTDPLKKSGFILPKQSFSNYPVTFQSVASSLNMDYLQNLLGQDFGDKAQATYLAIKHNRVAAELKKSGYKYVLIGSWWDVTQKSDLADTDLGLKPYIVFMKRKFETNGFEQLYYDSTLLGRLNARSSTNKDNHRYNALHQFDAIREATHISGNKFVFAHILLPHEPIVFDENGDWPKETDYKKGFIGQLKFTNKKVLEAVNAIQNAYPKDHQPVIILQADEGPYPKRDDKTVYSAAYLQEKMGILNAIYLPTGEADKFYEGISPVNTFRIIFNRYFGAKYEILADRHYFSGGLPGQTEKNREVSDFLKANENSR